MIDNSIEKITEGFKTDTFPTNEKDLDIDDEIQNISLGNLEKHKMTKPDVKKEKIEIKTIGFSDWFDKNKDNFDNVRQIKLSVRGVDPKKTQIFSSLSDSTEKTEDGFEERELHLFKEVDRFFVLDLKCISLDMFNNSFKAVVVDEGRNIYFKCYGIKTSLIIMNCVKIGDNLIPYCRNKLTLKNKILNNIVINESTVKKILKMDADIESLQIMYKQIIRDIDKITTNQDAINYLCKKQLTIKDMNHHIQIDEVIAHLLFPEFQSK